ncbi:MAG TPA: YdeI/OmpD-associated family protein [Vicinamibacterales bacterium]|nr:YdeI/OmpD-associated family protein [Vicinamibacterales bacterium]
MAPVIPKPRTVRSFKSEAAFEKWLEANHNRETEVWLKIFKKDSGVPTVTHPQALDVALCWGWIDGLRKSFDDEAFLQRFTPRRPKSIWSQVNRDHIARLTKAGRMTSYGQHQVDAAKADGRWAAAYAPVRETRIPLDLRKAIQANPAALRTCQKLGRMNVFALAFRVNNMKTAVGRERKIKQLVDMLAQGKAIRPERGLGTKPK